MDSFEIRLFIYVKSNFLFVYINYFLFRRKIICKFYKKLFLLRWEIIFIKIGNNFYLDRKPFLFV